eukprot:1976399-Pyramimonas_sp.AAC.1
MAYCAIYFMSWKLNPTARSPSIMRCLHATPCLNGKRQCPPVFPFLDHEQPTETSGHSREQKIRK